MGEFLDSGRGSSASLLGGRPFHFDYESPFLKLLVLMDLPATVAMIPVELLIALPARAVGLGFFSMSYLTAVLMLLSSTAQWLCIGYRFELRLRREASGLLRCLNRWAVVLIAAIVVATIVLTPMINQRSRNLGLRHGGISFH
jgi:hypothetical protein